MEADKTVNRAHMAAVRGKNVTGMKPTATDHAHTSAFQIICVKLSVSFGELFSHVQSHS